MKKPVPSRLFVSEYVCGGALSACPLGGSLAAEGWSMLCAVIADLAAVPGVSVETTCDERLSSWNLEGATVHRAATAEQEDRLFRRLCAECDGTLVIAPEFDAILETRCRTVEEVGGRLLGPSSAAVALCADKLLLARHLRDTGIPTIPTLLLDWELIGSTGQPEFLHEFPCVVKPRDGAGSQSMFMVADPAGLRSLKSARVAYPQLESAIWQPFVPGAALSCAVICDPSQNEFEALPVAEQRLSTDGRFQYLGGAMPWSESRAEDVQSLAVAACRSVEGLRGYVGVDVIAPAGTGAPIVVEINPRLTTSYLGYRELLAAAGQAAAVSQSPRGQLAERMAFPERRKGWRFPQGVRIEFVPASFAIG